MNAWQLIWRDIGNWLRRKRIFAMDVETFDDLHLIADRQNRSPNEVASQLFGQVVQDQDTQSWILYRWEQLSPRQKQITAYVCRGDTTPQIASQLHIAQTTVKTHLEAVLRKYDINSRIALRHLFEPWDLSSYL